MHFYIVCVLLTCGSQSWFYCFGIETPILTKVHASCDCLQRARHQPVSSNNDVYSVMINRLEGTSTFTPYTLGVYQSVI